MSQQSKSFADYMDRWTLLNNALKPLVPDFPVIAQEQLELEQLLLEGEQLRTSGEDAKARRSKTARLRRELLQHGRDVAGRLTAAMQFKLGFEAEELIPLGIRPRRRARQRPEVPPEDSLQPTAPPA
jgi:hypothetical protein